MVEKDENKLTKQQKNAYHSGSNGSKIKVRSVASKVMKLDKHNMDQMLEEYKKESRPYVLKPKYTSPTSLPLYFFFGYQLLQERNAMKKSGHVSDFS